MWVAHDGSFWGLGCGVGYEGCVRDCVSARSVEGFALMIQLRGWGLTLYE